jgi:hypothetical protein
MIMGLAGLAIAVGLASAPGRAQDKPADSQAAGDKMPDDKMGGDKMSKKKSKKHSKDKEDKMEKMEGKGDGKM